MRTAWIVGVSFFVLFASCTPEPFSGDVTDSFHASDAELIEIDIDIEPEGRLIELSEISSRAELIVLQTTEQSLIGHPQKMIATDSLLIIVDVMTKSIMVFDHNGRFQHQIGKLGRGPGNYTSISDFTVDVDYGFVYVLDSNTQTIHKYDFEGEFVSSIRLDGSQIRSFRILFHEGDLYCDAFFARPSSKNYLLRKINSRTGLEQERLLNIRYNKNWERIVFMGLEPFYPDHYSAPKYIPLFSDTVFCFEQGLIIPYLVFQGGHLTTRNDIKELSKGNVGLSSLMKMRKLYGIDTFLEFNNQILIRYRISNAAPWILFDKESGLSRSAKILSDDLVYKESNQSLLPEIICSDAKGFYCLVNSRQIARLAELYAQGLLHENVLNIEQLAKINELSNPVLIYHEYK